MSLKARINIQGTDLIYGKQQIEALTLQGNYSKNTLIVQGTAKAAAIRNSNGDFRENSRQAQL